MDGPQPRRDRAGARRRQARAGPARVLPSDLEVRGGGLAALVRQLVTDDLPFIQGVEAGGAHGRDVDEHVAVAVVRLDEAVALDGVEPLHRSLGLVHAPSSLSIGRQENATGPDASSGRSAITT